MHPTRVLLVGFLFIFCTAELMFSETNIRMELENFLYAHYTQEEPEETGNRWGYGGISALGIHITPEFVFKENFQMDALINSYLTKKYDGQHLSMNIREVFIDLLFYNHFSLKSGFLKMDYGFQNNHFHPLSAVDLLKEFRDLYGAIAPAEQNKGFKGVPGARVQISLPEYISGLNISIGQTVTFFDFNTQTGYSFEHFERNFFLSQLSVSWINIDAAIISGWSGTSLSNRPSSYEVDEIARYEKRPVYGGALGIILPFQFAFFWESTIKTESWRSYVENNEVKNYRNDSDYYINSDMRLEWSKLIKTHSLNLAGEYFYYGEGGTSKKYDQVYSYIIENTTDNSLYGADLPEDILLPQRSFYHYALFSGAYSEKVTQITAKLQAVYALKQKISEYTFTVSKDLQTVTMFLQFSKIFCKEKYRMLYNNKTFNAVFGINMVL